MKKKALIVTTFLLLLTGCGNTESTTQTTAEPTTVVTTEDVTTETSESTSETEAPTTEKQTPTTEEVVTEEPTTSEQVAETYNLPQLYKIGYTKPLSDEYIEVLKTGVCDISDVHCNFDKLLYRLKGGTELTYTQAIEHDMSEFSNVSKADLFADILCMSTNYTDVATDFIKALVLDYAEKGISVKEMNDISLNKELVTERIMKAMVSEESDDLALARENFQKLILDGKFELSYRTVDFNYNKYGDYDFWAVRSDLTKLKEISKEDRINFLADVVVMMTVASHNNSEIAQQLLTEFLSELANYGTIDANDLTDIKNEITPEKLAERIENATK